LKQNLPKINGIPLKLNTARQSFKLLLNMENPPLHAEILLIFNQLHKKLAKVELHPADAFEM